MWENIKKAFDTGKSGRIFNREMLLVVVLLGVLLFVIALPVREKEESGESSLLYSQGKSNDKLDASQEKDLSLRTEAQLTYAQEMEQRLREILHKMEGVGDVEVLITLKASEERVVEQEKQTNRSSTTEQDAQGGSRTVNTSELNPKVVYSTEGGASEPYVVKTYVPEIEGVLVVAQGAGNGTVDRTISGIVQALFGVEAHKVKVVKMEKSQS